MNTPTGNTCLQLEFSSVHVLQTVFLNSRDAFDGPTLVNNVTKPAFSFHMFILSSTSSIFRFLLCVCFGVLGLVCSVLR